MPSASAGETAGVAGAGTTAAVGGMAYGAGKEAFAATMAAGGVVSAGGTPVDWAPVRKIPAVKTAATRNVVMIFIVLILVLIVVLPVRAACIKRAKASLAPPGGARFDVFRRPRIGAPSGPPSEAVRARVVGRDADRGMAIRTGGETNCPCRHRMPCRSKSPNVRRHPAAFACPAAESFRWCRTPA